MESTVLVGEACLSRGDLTEVLCMFIIVVVWMNKWMDEWIKRVCVDKRVRTIIRFMIKKRHTSRLGHYVRKQFKGNAASLLATDVDIEVDLCVYWNYVDIRQVYDKKNIFS